MKKKIVIIITVILTIFSGFLFYNNINAVNMRKYIVIDESLYYGKKHYVRLTQNLTAVKLKDEIGFTDDKQQVYSIEGQDMDNWICVRADGIESVFREVSVKFLIIDNFKTNKLIVKEEGSVGGKQITIVEQKAVESILSSLTDKNLVKMPASISGVKQVNLYSNQFPGLCFKLYYLHDDNSNCFLYDSTTEEIWKTGHELMELIM